MKTIPSINKAFSKRKLVKGSLFLIFILSAVNISFAQSFSSLDRQRVVDILNNVKATIKGNYYDVEFHGIDIDARFKTAKEAVEKATSLGQAYGIVAQAVLELNDSHTAFFPPARPATFEYGWRWQMYGDKAYVTAVKPKSDAEKQGLKIGDEILSIENFHPNRQDMWKINYFYNALSPRVGLNLKVISPNDKEPRELNIAAKVTPQKTTLNIEDLFLQYEFSSDEVVEHRFVRVGNTTVWKMPTFSTEPGIVDNIMKGRIKQSPNMILDLRGNGGGAVVTLEELAGYFVKEDTKIADLKGRKKMDPQMAKTRKNDVYSGNLIVLVDANSASASEIFARFMQIQERGVVIGDHSAGAVMQSRGIPLTSGSSTDINYGMNMTNADVIMTDGISLEHIGVTPQLVVIPTGADLAAGKDPVLAAALKLFGENMTSADAGKLFPYRWKDNE